MSPAVVPKSAGTEEFDLVDLFDAAHFFNRVAKLANIFSQLTSLALLIFRATIFSSNIVNVFLCENNARPNFCDRDCLS
jgi:hypothetical protein